MRETDISDLLACEYVILVDSDNQPLGQEDKQEAHEMGLLHRAFSIFLFDTKGRMLLQQRAASKYHSGNLWANTCCGHPRPGEPLLEAANRRLGEELGIQSVTPLYPVDELIYHLNLEEGMQEHEYVHLLAGIYEGPLSPDADEVKAYDWVKIDELMDELQLHPSLYARWLRLYAHKRIEGQPLFEQALTVVHQHHERV